VLAQRPGDEDALAVKLYALIMAAKYLDALALLDSSEALRQRARLERAYCTWKAGRPADALELLDSASSDAEQHLKALLLMRKGEHMAAHAVYSKLLAGARGDKQAATELVRLIFPASTWMHWSCVSCT
jgi:hypothetical protein